MVSRDRGDDFEERLGKALEAIKNGRSQNESSKIYGIPKVCLFNQLVSKD